MLRERGLTLGLAESVTGGLVAGRLTEHRRRQRRASAARSCRYASEVKYDLLGVAEGPVVSERGGRGDGRGRAAGARRRRRPGADRRRRARPSRTACRWARCASASTIGDGRRSTTHAAAARSARPDAPVQRDHSARPAPPPTCLAVVGSRPCASVAQRKSSGFYGPLQLGTVRVLRRAQSVQSAGSSLWCSSRSRGCLPGRSRRVIAPERDCCDAAMLPVRAPWALDGTWSSGAAVGWSHSGRPTSAHFAVGAAPDGRQRVADHATRRRPRSASRRFVGGGDRCAVPAHVGECSRADPASRGRGRSSTSGS